MRKQLEFTVTVLIIILAVALVGCGRKSQGEDVAPVSEAAVPPTATASTGEPAPAESQSTPKPTTAAGSQPAATSEAQPEAESLPAETEFSEALIFNLSGGVIGFCDRLDLSQTGDYNLNSCGQEFSGTLEPADLETLQNWLESLAGFSFSFEDTAEGSDNLVAELQFNGQGTEEADETQRQIIFDWVNGLLLRLRPQPTPPPAEEAPPIGPEGLCPEIQRPAILVADYENPSNLILIDPDSQASCDILLPRPPFGRILTAAGNIYYPAFDPEAETLTIVQLSPGGERAPLTFTTVPMGQFGPFNFVLSGDGRKIAWAQTLIDFEVEPPVYRNSLWIANIDGSDQATLLDQAEAGEARYVELIRFSQDNQILDYALQPDGLGGDIFSFSGRFDNVYRVLAAGGEPQLLFVCPPENRICVGDVSPDGNFLTYSQPGEGMVQVLNTGGGLVNSLPAPATDFVGPAIFGPAGNLAFISASLSQPEESTEDLPQPNPGYLNFIRPPYTGQPDTLLVDNSVAAIWEWLDGDRLAYGPMDEAGNVGTAIVTVTGQVTELSPNFALAVLR